jgi:hypothetical protein
MTGSTGRRCGAVEAIRQARLAGIVVGATTGKTSATTRKAVVLDTVLEAALAAAAADGRPATRAP